MKKPPNLYVIAGPNGAGKTTFAREFLPHYAKCENFVNADLIAGGIAPFSPETAALRAGRLLLEQIHLLARKHSDFGFETTLSGVTYVSLLWMFFDNSGVEPRLIAREEVGELRVFDQQLFTKIMEAARR